MTYQLELVGVAGTGKSTLTRLLGERFPQWEIAESLHTRKPEHLRYAVRALPAACRLETVSLRRPPLLSWDEVKFVLYAAGWRRFLAWRAATVTVLDQGPIFALARLLWSGKPVTRSSWFLAWLDETLAAWAESLDLIVWLDAPDAVLLGRINTRVQAHETKQLPSQDALDILAAHRHAYGELRDRLARLGRPHILDFDTGSVAAPEMAEEIGRLVAGTGSVPPRTLVRGAP
jgi:hypothetical protein